MWILLISMCNFNFSLYEEAYPLYILNSCNIRPKTILGTTDKVLDMECIFLQNVFQQVLVKHLVKPSPLFLKLDLKVIYIIFQLILYIDVFAHVNFPQCNYDMTHPMDFILCLVVNHWDAYWIEDCAFPEMGAGNQTWVLCSKCS